MSWFSKDKKPSKDEKKEDPKKTAADKQQKQKGEKDLAKQYQSSKDQFVYDTVLQYTNSEMFGNPIIRFIDESSALFAFQEQSIIDDVFTQYRKLVADNLSGLCETVGMDIQSLIRFIQKMVENPLYKKYLKLMTFFFEKDAFVRCMTNRNEQLNKEAAREINKTTQSSKEKGSRSQPIDPSMYMSVPSEELKRVMELSLQEEQFRNSKSKNLKQQEDDELEQAIIESKKWYEDYLRRLEQEEEEFRRALKLSLEQMRQLGIDEDEEDKRLRLEQEKHFQDEKERAKKEIKRLELEADRLNEERAKRMQELEAKNVEGSKIEKNLQKENSEREKAIEKERLRQIELKKEEQRLIEQNRQMELDLQNRMKQKAQDDAENERRRRKQLEEEENARKAQLEEEEERRRLKEEEERRRLRQLQEKQADEEERKKRSLAEEAKKYDQELANRFASTQLLQQPESNLYDQNDNVKGFSYKLDDQFDRMFKDINDFEPDRERECLGESAKYKKQPTINDEGLNAMENNDSAKQRRERALQQRAMLLNQRNAGQQPNQQQQSFITGGNQFMSNSGNVTQGQYAQQVQASEKQPPERNYPVKFSEVGMATISKKNY